VNSVMQSIETGACATYARLLEEFLAARDEWNKRRTEITNLGLRGKRTDDELRCLQARFAKSYSLVLNHLHDCDSCESARGNEHDAVDVGDNGFGLEFRVSLFSNAQYSRFQINV
jgi:hypothetical protein